MNIRTTDTYSKPFEILPCGNGTTYKIGQGLIISSGVAALATGTNKPQYICQENKTGVTGEGVYAARVTEDMTLEAPLSAAGTDLTVGSLVTIATDGMRLTATTTNGVAEIIEFPEGKASGAKVRFKL